MKVKLLTVENPGVAGHRGYKATAATLREDVWWPDFVKDAQDFVHSCVLCVFARKGSFITQPLSSTLHSSLPNEVIHFDYLFLGDSEKDDKYVLVVKDNFSGCMDLPFSHRQRRARCKLFDAVTENVHGRTILSLGARYPLYQ